MYKEIFLAMVPTCGGLLGYCAAKTATPQPNSSQVCVTASAEALDIESQYESMLDQADPEPKQTAARLIGLAISNVNGSYQVEVAYQMEPSGHEVMKLRCSGQREDIVRELQTLPAGVRAIALQRLE